VLDLGRVVAAPFACQILGDLGADIIKVERPGRGDESRHYGPSFLDMEDGFSTSGFYLAFNRNKRSITVDLARPEGQDLIRRLTVECDVLVENFKMGDLARKGLGYGDLLAINPALVYCSITGFGHTGPYAAYPAVDMVFQAMSGMMSVTGESGGPPQKVGIVAADLICGLYAANAIQAALRARDHNGGRGQHIDLSLLDCAVSAMSHRIMDYFITGEVPHRSGNKAPGTAPAQLFRCNDGLLNVQAGTDSQFAKLCAVLELPRLLEDPLFRTGADRLRHRDQLLPALETIFAEASVARWYDRLVAGGVICSPVYDVEGTFSDPQVAARELAVSMCSGDGHEVKGVRNPIRLSEQPISTYTFPPSVGAHTDEVLAEVLGLSSAKIESLHASGAV
jgi:crotonobetainyl-CoA:carnitine CoA-transferase CaiB-like acyl-CoA transferase